MTISELGLFDAVQDFTNVLKTDNIFVVLVAGGIKKKPVDVWHLKFKGVMNMSEKVGRQGRGL